MKILYNRKQTSEKKNLIKCISELTSVKAKYLGAPSMVYEIGPYQVDRDGNLIAPDDQDAMDLVLALKLYGYEETIPEGAEEPEESEAEEALVETTAMEADEATAETIEETNTEAPIAETIAEAAEESETEEAEVEETAVIEPIAEAVPQNTESEATPVSVNIAFPLSQHTSRSIRNLVNLLYSRGSLVSKAVQGEFSAPKEIVNELDDNKDLPTAKAQVERIRQIEAEKGITLKGIAFDEEKVIFTGFPETADADVLLAFQHLVEKMNKQAITQKRIQSKVVDEENEKYAMRTWLVRIGMDGSKYKNTRNILMEHLKGHTAFRTPADADRWKAKQAKLREERKANQEKTAE